MAKYKITGMPNQKTSSSKLNFTLGPVDRKIANVEAELGETVVRNSQRGSDNIFEMYNIGGKKHTKGGTPLSLETDGGKDSDGTSFIFSDNKKMIVKDPAILEYFGVDPKKPKTYAEISKTWLEAVNKSKQIIKDELSDKVSKKSATMSMDNAAFKIAALKLKQEAHKGMRDGVPNGMSPFFDKLQLDPSQLFAMNQDDVDKTEQAATKAFGGNINKSSANLSFDYDQPESENPNYYSLGGNLRKFTDVGEVSKASIDPYAALNWGTVNKKAQKQYKYIVTKLASNEAFKEALFEEYKKEAEKEDNFGAGYNAQFKKDKNSKNNVVRKNKEDVFQDYVDFQRRNLMLYSHGKLVAGTDQNPTSNLHVSNKDVTDWSVAHGVPLPAKIDDAAAQQLSYIAFEKLSLNRDEYGKKLQEVLKPFGVNPVGKGDERIAGSTEDGQTSKADGKYTNTTAGEISYFTEPEEEEEKKQNKPVVDDEEDVYNSANYEHLKPKAYLQNPYGFRREDINALQRATQARYQIPEFHPYTKSSSVVMPDRAYYSPERSIAAKNEQLGMAMNNQNAFGNAQSAGANNMALIGQAYGDVANTISDYADKNVGIFNAGEQYNAQLATQRNQQDSAIATNTWDKENTLKQNLANSVSAAKDKITQLSNQAYTNAANIYNLNTTTDNFKKDPYSGLITKLNDKELNPTKNAAKDIGREFNDFARMVPGLPPKQQIDLFKAHKSGKWVIEKDDEITQPSELENEGIV